MKNHRWRVFWPKGSECISYTLTKVRLPGKVVFRSHLFLWSIYYDHWQPEEQSGRIRGNSQLSKWQCPPSGLTHAGQFGVLQLSILLTVLEISEMIQELSTVFVFIKILLKMKMGGVQFINRPGFSMECLSVCFRSDTDDSTQIALSTGHMEPVIKMRERVRKGF